MLQIVNTVDSHHAHLFHIFGIKEKLDNIRTSLNNIIEHAMSFWWSPEIEDEFISLSNEEEKLARQLITA